MNDLTSTEQVMEFSPTNPPALVINNIDGREVVRIAYDGKVTLGEGIVPDEAAKAFWEAVERVRSLHRVATREGPI